MATLTNEQIEQKKQLIVEKMKQMKAIYDELVEAGAIELSEDELDQIAGGGAFVDFWTKAGDWLGDNVCGKFESFIKDVGGLLGLK
jgi:hypothetical protein